MDQSQVSGQNVQTKLVKAVDMQDEAGALAWHQAALFVNTLVDKPLLNKPSKPTLDEWHLFIGFPRIKISPHSFNEMHLGQCLEFCNQSIGYPPRNWVIP